MFAARVLIAISTGWSAAPRSPADGPTDAAVRAAVERGLRYVEEEGVAWMETQACNSCHRVPFLIWSHREAARKGVPVDPKKLDDWTRWALDDTFEPRFWFRLRPKSYAGLRADGVPDAFLTKLADTRPTADMIFVTKDEFVAAMKTALTADEYARYGDRLLRHAASPNNGGAPDTMSQLILARYPIPNNSPAAKRYDQVRSLLLEWQEPDGYWMGGGQQPSQRRPRAEIHEATTKWTVLALTAAGADGHPPSAAARGRALKWLAGGRPGASTETLLLRAVIEHRFGDAGKAGEWYRQLLREQHADGGWSWVRAGNVSDAFATGQVLYGLALLGRGDAPAARRARKFLVDMQLEDGSWSVPAAEITTVTGKVLDKVRDGYHYWGSAWAVIGLARTLPDPAPAPAGGP